MNFGANGSGPPAQSDAQSSAVADVVVLFVVALVLLVVFGAAVGPLGLRASVGRKWGALLGVGLPEVLGLLLPAVGFVWRKRQLQQLRRLLVPRDFAQWVVRLGSGVLLGMGLFYFLAAWIEPLYEQVVRISPAEQRALQRMIAPATGLRPLWLDLVTFAGIPAVCEEVLFRGAILGALIPSLGERPRFEAPWTSLLPSMFLSALLFGMIHLSFGRMVPTMLLGMAFAAAVLRGGSLWTAMAMHAVNNSLVVLMVRHGQLSFSAIGKSTKLWLLPLALVVTAIGCVLLVRPVAAQQSERDA